MILIGDQSLFLGFLVLLPDVLVAISSDKQLLLKISQQVQMVSGELTIMPHTCVLNLNQPEESIEAVLHMKVGEHHLQTQPINSSINKQFAWKQILKIALREEDIIHFWLSDVMKAGQEKVLGQCRINLNVISKQRFPLIFFWKGRQTALIDVELEIERKLIRELTSSKIPKAATMKLTVKSATLVKNTELFGSMTPAVRVKVEQKAIETHASKGKDPVWNKEMIFQNVKETDDVFITVLDKEMIGKDDIIGNIFTTIEELKSRPQLTLQIMNKDEVAGTLIISAKQCN